MAGRNEEKLSGFSDFLTKEGVDSSTFISNYPIDEMKYSKILEIRQVRTVISMIGTGYPESLPFIGSDSIIDTIQSNLMVNLDIIKKSSLVLKSCRGNIVIFNSIAGIIPQEGSSVYTASKFALRGLIENLRYEIRNFNIGLSSLYFQNVEKIGITPILDSVMMAIKNKSLNFDFIINA